VEELNLWLGTARLPRLDPSGFSDRWLSEGELLRLADEHCDGPVAAEDSVHRLFEALLDPCLLAQSGGEAKEVREAVQWAGGILDAGAPAEITAPGRRSRASALAD